MPSAPGRRSAPDAPRTATPSRRPRSARSCSAGCCSSRAVGLWPGDVIVWPLAAALVGLALLAMRTPPSGATAELPDWPMLQRLPPDAADAVAVLVGTRRGALARDRGGRRVRDRRARRVRRQRRLVARAARHVRRDRRGASSVSRSSSVPVCRGSCTRSSPSGASASAPTSAPRSPRTCTTRCCRRSRSCSAAPTTRARSCGSRACRSASCARGCSAATRPAASASTSLGAALEEIAAAIETEHGVPVEVVRVRDCGIDGHRAAARPRRARRS